MTANERSKNIQNFKDRIENNIKRFGKNFPWKAWLPDQVMVNENYYKCVGKPKTVFSGRFCAVSGYIFAIVNGKYSVLANLRGQGTPDYQGCWNAPCGFLECFETSKEGIQREIYEECGFYIDTNDLTVIDVETEPEECNNSNVTIRHRAFLGKIIPIHTNSEGGEENEVDGITWVPIDDIDDYKWAFNHRKIILKFAPKKWKRRLIEIFYKLFRNYNYKYTDEYDVMMSGMRY